MTVVAQPGILYTAGVFVCVIGLLVFVHEFGHYYVARLCGVRADTFSIGFGREVLGWSDRRGTRWKLGWLPLGGYVKFAGDLNAASETAPDIDDTPVDQRAGLFHFAPLWQKALITAAGPLTNFALAIAIFAGFFMTYGAPLTPSVVGRVDPAGRAAAAGIAAGDRIVAIDGARVERFEQVSARIAIDVGEPLTLRLERGSTTRTVEVTPKVLYETDRFGNRYQIGRLGIQSGPARYERLGVFAALPAAAVHTVEITKSSLVGLWQVVSGRRPLDQMGGPIKMAQLSGQQASLGLPNLVEFIALISINLGFINLLPIPMLDGGHLFLYALEAIRRRPLGERVQQWAFMSGFAALISLMVVLTFNDLGSVGVWKHLTGLLG